MKSKILQRGFLLFPRRKELLFKLHNNYTKDLDENQILIDKASNGKERPWRQRKLKSLELMESYKRIGYDNKAERVQCCGYRLDFEVDGKTGEKRLVGMISCQTRLCSMCNWRRSMKIFGQVSKVMNKALEEGDYRFIFLTLTCKNVEGKDLSSLISTLFKSFDRLCKRAAVKRCIKGWFRALEVTHDVEEYVNHDMWYGNRKKHLKSRARYYRSIGLKIGDSNPNFDTYHSHYHVVMMVNKSYFTDKTQYLSHEDWTRLWKESLRVDYTPIVNVKVFKTSDEKQLSRSVAESAKYSAKDNDYLIEDNQKMTDKTVKILDKALANRRLVAFGGMLRQIHRELNLDDPEDGDLVHIESENEMREDVNCMIERYYWHVGYRQYLRMDN